MSYCLSVLGPCEKQCDRCAASIQATNDRLEEERIAIAIKILESRGYNVRKETK